MEAGAPGGPEDSLELESPGDMTERRWYLSSGGASSALKHQPDPRPQTQVLRVKNNLLFCWMTTVHTGGESHLQEGQDLLELGGCQPSLEGFPLNCPYSDSRMNLPSR